jgi:ribosome-binding protein aMBF1 (putative translation factor)
MLSYMASISDQLRKAMDQSGLSNRALSIQTGVARPSIIRFRRGDATLQLEAVDKLAKALKLKLVKQ